jgi:excisionase family DNA binding protein
MEDISMIAIRTNEPEDDRLLDAKQVAAMLGVPATWVYAQSREGRLPTVHLGRYKRYRRSAIEAYTHAQERTAG